MEIIFYVFSVIIIISSLMVVLSKNPLTSALYLILSFFVLAGFYVILDMQFIAAMQILVYAGAIMVLVVLVIMLLNLSKYKNIKTDMHQKFVSVLIFIILLGEVFLFVIKGNYRGATGIYTAEVIKKIGNTQLIGSFLFTKYIFPFEVSSVLLLVALIGAYLFAKKRF